MKVSEILNIKELNAEVGLIGIIGNFKNPLVSREQLNKQGVIK
jgi:non-canonical (house-cleaning) NTP pyrophosphatase